MAARAQALGQRFVRGALDRRFARRIDRRHDHRIRIVETGAELAEKTRQAAYSDAAA